MHIGRVLADKNDVGEQLVHAMLKLINIWGFFAVLLVTTENHTAWDRSFVKGLWKQRTAERDKRWLWQFVVVVQAFNRRGTLGFQQEFDRSSRVQTFIHFVCEILV